MAATDEPVLDVRDLSVVYHTRRGPVQALRQLSFAVRPGEALALIGESGCGKTTLGLSLVGLLPPSARITQGHIAYQTAPGSPAIDLRRLNPRQLRRWRWQSCAMVFQGAQNAFNPVLRIADHFQDTARAHGYLRGRALFERSRHLLQLVRLDPDRVWRSFPHELSGGMRQRVLIALSLLLGPQLLILDEPTTALDLLTQRSLIEMLQTLRQQLNFALIVISHDLALANELADRMATMYAGRIVEIADTRMLLNAPAHPYTIGLLNALPTITNPNAELASIPGAPPDLSALPGGCAFQPRCPLADEATCSAEPPLLIIEPQHQSACWHWQRARGSAVSTQEAHHVADHA